jgi:RimJ/RimL family protein N-acetyltransferase
MACESSIPLHSRPDAEGWVRYCLESYKQSQQRSAYHFAIELRSQGTVIGGTGLERIDYFQGTAGGGIWINERYHGQGYGTEAFGERIRFAFEDLQLRRIENGYFRDNTASLHVQVLFCSFQFCKFRHN